MVSYILRLKCSKRLIFSPGRQTAHPTATRVATEQVHRYWARRYNKARMDIEHRTRLVRKLSGTCAAPALHEHWNGSADGGSEDALYGEDGATSWTAACNRGMTYAYRA